MNLIKILTERWKKIDHPFLVHDTGALRFSDIKSAIAADLDDIQPGEVVALIGDFDPATIATMLRLIDKGVILVPLTTDTTMQHEYFFKSSLVDVVVHGNSIKRIKNSQDHSLIKELRAKKHAGLVLFSTGTTGRPKAILHDLTFFVKRFETPRPTLKTINFLLFDHIGGLNTLFHTLFNKGTIVAPKSRNVIDILEACNTHKVEVLPTTPTFLRMMLMSGFIPDKVPKTLKIITYGTERMDQPTLSQLCALLPTVDFRQTFGMSELGILRVKSEARNSLFMKIGGEGVTTRVINQVLEIRSDSRMLGYLNAPSPFDNEGWYHTKDIVEVKDDYYKVIGRTSEVINVGGLKFMASEVERVVLEYAKVALAKAEGKENPITGQHVELTIQPIRNSEIDKTDLKIFLSSRLPSHMMPKRLRVKDVEVGHRYKKI